MGKITDPFKATRYTERTVNQILVEWINKFIEELNLPLGKAKQEMILADQKQPDILIFDKDNKRVICLIELKIPSWDIYDSGLVHDAYRKSNRVNAAYFATWNINRLVFFSVKKYEEVKDSNKSISEAIIQNYIFNNIKTLEQIEEPEHKANLQENIKKFLKDLVNIAIQKKAFPKIAVDEFFKLRLKATVDTLELSFKSLVINKCSKDAKFLKEVRKWFIEQAWSFSQAEEDYEKLARQSAYLLVNKLVFYGALQEKLGLDPLEIPQSLTSGERLQKILKAYFDDILKIDYETIFTTDFIDEIAFPQDKHAIDSVKDVVAEINRHKLSSLGYDVLGDIFQKLIPIEERHLLGQYFTNSDIVDFILKFCLKDEKDFVIDPGCGAGTFLVRAYQHKKLINPRLEHNDILPTLWGIDISKFASHLSTINLAINDLGSTNNYPRIIHKDFFEVNPLGIGFSKPTKVKGLDKIEKEVEHPKNFDVVVGNPPYTRQEEIEDLSADGYKESLIDKALHETGANISKRAGIHAYFFVHGTKFLKDSGRFGFIVSNSWLDVDYGKGLQEFFLKNYKITAIIESKVERWFEDADINTCITILEKCTDKKEREENYVRFVQLKKKLRYFIPLAQSIWEKEIKRLDEIDKLIKLILGHKESYENEDIKIYPVKQIDLWNEGFNAREGYIGSKWGKYIRAPEIFFKIVEKGKDLFVSLNKDIEVIGGMITGNNDFFYLKDDEIKLYDIENIYLVPALKSPREINGILVKKEKLEYKILSIKDYKAKLKSTNVLKYIEKAESELIHEAETFRTRKIWFQLPALKYAPLLWVDLRGDKHLCHFNTDKVPFEHNFYGLKPLDKDLGIAYCSYLNSSLCWLFIEIIGRTGLGGGAIRLVGKDLNLFPVIDFKEIRKNVTQKLEQSFNKLCQHEIGSVFEEIGANSPEEVSLDKVKPDRRELDKIIMGEILGLSEKEQLEVYKAVIDLVKSRIEKAKSLSNKNKVKKGIDVNKAVEIMLNSIGKDTFINFYKANILTQKADTITIPRFKESIKILRTLKGYCITDKKRRRIADKKEGVDCKTYEEAKYIAILATIGMEKIAIPRDEAYLKQILPKLEKTTDMIKEELENYCASIVDKKLQMEIKQKAMGAIINGVK